ncbi:MAG TPA: M67 family metallopeptidase [Anaerolineales bacterium]
MTLHISEVHLRTIEAYAEAHYPEEGAGLILGDEAGEKREAREILPLPNRREAGERGHRYEIDPLETLAAEDQADALGLKVIGVFHSHPDHPAAPSQTDLHFAVPWYSYLITSVRSGRAHETRAWRLDESEAGMQEEQLEVRPVSERRAGDPDTPVASGAQQEEG